MTNSISQTDLDILQHSVQDILAQLYDVPGQNIRALHQLVDELELMAASILTLSKSVQSLETLLSAESAEHAATRAELDQLDQDLKFPHRSQDDRVLNLVQEARETGRQVTLSQMIAYVRGLTGCSMEEAEDLLNTLETWSLSHDFHSQKLMTRLLRQAAAQIARAG